MADLFDHSPSRIAQTPLAEAGTRPLADRLRPQSVADIVGQDKALDPKGPLGRMLATNRLSSLILWGPPGCGKTTLARLLAKATGRLLIPLSAVMSGVADLRKAFDQAKKLKAGGQVPILFIDEIHRYHRGQQDGLLHAAEEGTVTLIGATTENPSFALNPALVSRCHVLVLNRLDEQALMVLIDRAEAELCHKLPLDEAGRASLAQAADGDGRYLLNLVESLADLDPEPLLSAEELAVQLQRRMPVYDRQYEAHYNLVSALHKSIRGSDPDAALYWLCRMLQGGEDPRFIGRRLIRMASEDIGLADPDALNRAIAATEAYERLGSPEGELMLAQCAVGLALAPKSNAVYKAYKAASASAREQGSLMPPAHILNAPSKLMKDLGYGAGYAYDHDAPDSFSGQNYFPDAMDRPSFYEPTDQGVERRIGEKMNHLNELRAKRRG